MRDFAPPEVSGDRSLLSFDERELLEAQILPTAHRWLKRYPNLRRAARVTLDYWGETYDLEAAE